MVSRLRRHGLLAGLIAAVLLIGVVIADGMRPAGAEPPATLAAPEPVVPASEGRWVASWSAAPTGGAPEGPRGLPERSVRNVLYPAIAGSGVRVEISNRYGHRPLVVRHVTVALAREAGPAAVPESMRRLMFDGEWMVSVPAGGSVLSDPVRLEVPAGSALLVSVFAPESAGPVTYHRSARQTSFVALGDVAGDVSGKAFTETVPGWRYVTAVQLLSAAVDGSVVVLGDSLTDGTSSTPGNRRWTDFLARRLWAGPDGPRLAVVNAGISGNQLLRDAAPDRPFRGRSGLERLHTDVLPQAGTRAVVVQLGINDIIRSPGDGDPGEIVAGLRQLTGQARAAELRVVGATLAPFEGHVAWTPERELVRQRVNAAIRAGAVFDAVVDFDAALRDPERPARLLPRYDSGDHLHPNDEGFRLMAAALDPRSLRPRAEAAL